MNRTRDWRRAQTKKKISKRLDIVRNAWQYGMNNEDYLEYLEQRGNKLNKFNLNCGCRMCQLNKIDPVPEFTLQDEIDAWEDDYWIYDEDRNPLDSWDNPLYRYTEYDVWCIDEYMDYEPTLLPLIEGFDKEEYLKYP